jgi:hypothetical protein
VSDLWSGRRGFPAQFPPTCRKRFSYRLVDVLNVPAKLSGKLSGLSCAWLRGNELASSMKWRASDDDVPPWPQDDAALDPFSPSGY